MGRIERQPNGMEDIDRMYSFLSSKETNKFYLTEPQREGVVFGPILAVFFQRNKDSVWTFNLRSSGPKPDMLEIYSRILAMEIPQRVKDLRITDNKRVAERNKRKASLQGRPYIVLAFGQTKDTVQEVIGLFMVPGVSPKAGLNIIKEFASKRIANFN